MTQSNLFHFFYHLSPTAEDHAMRGDTQPIETEIKLRFPPDARCLLEQHPTFRSSHASKPEEREVVTTYLDTPDQMLSRRGISLRVRRIGSTFVQTVKRPWRRKEPR